MKCYPTPEEYQRIGQQIIEKYPFLKSPVGVPYVSNQQGRHIDAGVTCALIIHTLGAHSRWHEEDL